jgi:NAD(P)-dependent dehydrogenase (short-subunit alcohol dehydrogenase family)
VGSILKNRRALITGGGRGIGAAVARRFAAEGARLFLVARSPRDLEKVAVETGADFELCDVTDPEEVERTCRKAGPVDILVNNAGIAESAPFLRTDLAMWRRALDTNVTAPYRFSFNLVPGMVQRGYGRIVNVASASAKKGAPYLSAYSASKHALLGLNASLAMELQPYGVLVNAICPGYVDTPMTRANALRVSRSTGETARETLRRFLSSAGQARLLHPNHVAEVVLALSRSECSHTGAAIDL